tara:strand:- start:6905 stop:7474 length:570 start_codon:yes stop_codon:yes gene_type:complete
LNIFVLDRDPVEAAKMQCDRHVVKMIIESAQMLSAAIDVNYKFMLRGDPETKPSEQLGLPGYPPAHIKHPCTMWVIDSLGNYKWLIKHMRALCYEYRLRYGKVHKSEGCLMIYEGQIDNLFFPKEKRTEFVKAMPDKYKVKDPVISYRVFYNMDKFPFAKWKLGNVPDWYTGGPTYHVELENSDASSIN